MAKLTRTSKFADLRGQITNDRESGVVTNDLSSYQNRLNSVQGQLDPRMQEQMSNTQSFNNYNNNYQQPAYNQQPQYTTAQFEQPQQVQQPQQTFNNLNMNNNSYNDYNNNYQQSSNNSMNKTLTIDDIYNDVFSSMNQGQDSVNNNINNDYMEQTFSGVNSYNMNNGQQTLNDILDSNVDAVRHQQSQQSYQYQQQPVNQQPLNNTNNGYQSNPQLDKEFSNTVSLEISKIMDGIDNNASNQQQNVRPQQTQQVQQPQQGRVVDIKNIRDTEPVTRDTMSETIPFVVSDQDVDEYDDEEGSNTVLNIILIVLIIILLAVLGMIVFYILKTKGIL